MTVIGCIAHMHDVKLVLIALITCALSSFTALKMIGRAQASSREVRLAWTGAGGFAFGCGVWATHFVAVLAYRPDMPVSYNALTTAVSLVIAISGSAMALILMLDGSKQGAIGAGMLLGGVVALMHYAGMSAMMVPGIVALDSRLIVASLAIGMSLAPIALLLHRKGRMASAVAVLVLAICGLHFVAVAAISIIPDGRTIAGIATASLAIAVAAVSLLVILVALIGVLVDEHLARRAQEEHVRVKRFADATFEGLLFVKAGIIADANAVACAMLERSVEALIGTPLHDVFAAPHGPSRGRNQGLMDAACLDVVETSYIDGKGARRFVEVLGRPATEADRGLVILAVRDISDRKRAEDRIERLAHFDSLTGLANRLLFRDRVQVALAVAERSKTSIAMLCLDLDRFKAVNDLMGHPIGDKLLMQVAQRIRTLTRDTDTVARLGSDEFAIVQSAAEEPGDAAALAQRLVERLGEPYEIDGCTLCISASIGIAIYPTDGDSAEQLQRHAGLALHRAKHLGRNAFCFFEPEMDMALQARRALELDLRGALERNELHLHYQPLFDGADLHVVGWEALMRWEHPTRGNISPAEFIPAAEECGFIQQLGYWALETACREAASWETQDRIAVNLSPAQFRQRDLVERVTGIIERSGLAPERLELEVTEGVLIDDSERALSVLRAFKALGIRIALDDFGTGYSSLSYLRRFPFDKIKIDRSFVTEVGKTQEADEIVRAILALSRTLGLAVTAEGVETREQLAMLRANRCDQIQGFYLGRPSGRDMPRGMRRAPAALRVVPAEPVHLAAS